MAGTPRNKRPYTDLEQSPELQKMDEKALRNILDECLDRKFAEALVEQQRIITEGIRSENIQLKKEVKELRSENEKLKERVIANEIQSRRDNLILHGIPESRNENLFNKILEALASAGIPFTEREIVRCHRLGKFIKHRQRPVIVRFHHYHDNMMIIKVNNHL